MQMKEVNIWTDKKRNKPIRPDTFQVAKSTIWYRKKREYTGKLHNIKTPGRPHRPTNVDDQRIVSLQNKKKSLNPWKQLKNIPEKVGVSWKKKCTIKRRFQEWKYRGFTTNCKLVTFKNSGARLYFARKDLPKFWNHIC